MASEDFSFPKITSSTPQFTFSSSLWRASSLVFPSFDDNFFDHSERVADLGRNYSFSCPESSDQEGKMDVLWEDFNEKELQMVCSKERSSKNGEAKAEETNNNNNMMEEICCVETLKMSKRGTGGGGGFVHHHHQHKRKKNMGLFVKVLIRKIFNGPPTTRLNNNNYCVWAPQSGI